MKLKIPRDAAVKRLEPRTPSIRLVADGTIRSDAYGHGGLGTNGTLGLGPIRLDLVDDVCLANAGTTSAAAVDVPAKHGLLDAGPGSWTGTWPDAAASHDGLGSASADVS